MRFLLDTNVLSEFSKDTPDPNVAGWVQANQPHLYTSTISMGELEYGIAILPDGKRKRALVDWLKRTNRIMEGKVFSFNLTTAYVWADMRARLHRDGYRLPFYDGMIAAIAKRYGLTVATRNTKDFEAVGVPVFNPSQ